ncbi:MAG: inositol monophosphatase [Bacteroidia bacterium]|jgi:myo-inositol-1(or 4)-monophosphatase|nr:inositol monophosphatase [Bacteroidia bacterium]
MNTLNSAQLADLCATVQTISMRVGEFIRSQREVFKPGDVEEKSHNNLVSYVDKTAEQMFVDALAPLLPEAGFITEEDDQRATGTHYNWIIDPLDGTTNFVHGVPCYATSVALAENGVPVLGVIYEIGQDECFYGWRNGGCWCNGKRVHIAQTRELRRALLGTGFPYYDHGLLKPYLALFEDLLQNSTGLRRPGSAATDMAYVACGRFDAFYEYGLHSWDVAAGIILIEEAGGVVTDFEGKPNPLSGSRIVCGTPGVHAELLEKIKHYFPPGH